MLERLDPLEAQVPSPPGWACIGRSRVLEVVESERLMNGQHGSVTPARVGRLDTPNDGSDGGLGTDGL